MLQSHRPPNHLIDEERVHQLEELLMQFIQFSRVFIAHQRVLVDIVGMQFRKFANLFGLSIDAR